MFVSVLRRDIFGQSPVYRLVLLRISRELERDSMRLCMLVYVLMYVCIRVCACVCKEIIEKRIALIALKIDRLKM